MYVMLVEKAFAKVAGSYSVLKGGASSRAWLAMTGCTDIGYYDFDDFAGHWIEAQLDTSPAAVPFKAAMVSPRHAAIAPDSRSQTGSVASPARAASRSAPALNTRPVPVRISSFASRAPSAISASTVSMSGVSAPAL